MAKAKDGGYIGVAYARFALINPDTGIAIPDGIPGADENGIYKVTTKVDGGVSTANLSGLAPSVTRIWGNNAVADISTGKAQPSMALGINFLSHQVLAAILGRESDGKGGYDLEGKPVDVAVEVVSNTVIGGEVHFAFYDGYMTPGDLALATDNENETRVTDALTFTPFANDDNHVGKIYYSGEDGFSQAALDKEIFGVDPATTPVQPTTVAVTGVTLDKTTVSVGVGKVAQVTATVAPDNATDKTTTYTVEDKEVATVTNDGSITGVKAGSTTATVTAGSKTATVAITVTE